MCKLYVLNPIEMIVCHNLPNRFCGILGHIAIAFYVLFQFSCQLQDQKRNLPRSSYADSNFNTTVDSVYGQTEIQSQTHVNSQANYLIEKEQGKINSSLNVKLAKEKLKQQKLLILTALTALLLLSFITYYLFQRTKYRKKIQDRDEIILQQNDQLKLNLAELSKKSIEISKTNKKLSYVLERRNKVVDRQLKFNHALEHDLRQPLTASNLFATFLKKSLASKLDEKEGESLNCVVQSIKQISNLVETLHLYSNNTTMLLRKFKLVDLNQIINNVKINTHSEIVAKNAEINCEDLG
ncbi:MAG: histidine kinase dimerization/phospho-acceptor domain-containing protein, partial [Flavobacteriaceae bacterium]